MVARDHKMDTISRQGGSQGTAGGAFGVFQREELGIKDGVGGG